MVGKVILATALVLKSRWQRADKGTLRWKGIEAVEWGRSDNCASRGTFGGTYVGEANEGLPQGLEFDVNFTITEEDGPHLVDIRVFILLLSEREIVTCWGWINDNCFNVELKDHMSKCMI